MPHNRSPRARWWRRHFGYPLEAALAYILYGLMALLPLDTASAFGGWLGRRIGPHLRLSQVAEANLRRFLPEHSPGAHRALLAGIWDNLGRVMAEYPHLERIWREGRVEFVGGDAVEALVRAGGPVVMVSAHMANWELLPRGAEHLGLPLTLVYRRPNNPLVDNLLARARRGHLVPKGRDGAKEMLAALRGGGTIGLLVDQKLNDGIPVPFFGAEAMTTPAPAMFALRFRCPLLMVRIERLHGAHFRLTVAPPLELPDSGDRNADIAQVTHSINRTLEDWIRQRPTQWLWLHHRWPA